ncbi:hypothetical protein K7X08_003153 [Anisodus acutangulus]|uniref:SKP1-like protein n=1 Tax=Anisodus acutangulus TaxID=402998 RepID=A0A9Q1MDI4_9SOLA|nr:hypothetical protein K7X08_003153 [Anisodus acutangulus]
MASTSQESKILILKSSEGVEFEMEESIAVQSGTIKNMVEDDCTVFPLPNVDTKTLIKIIEYIKKHADAEKTDSNEDEIKTFDKEFVKITIHDLFELVLAANYLHISSLMDLLCRTIADRIKNKSYEAVRKIFNITIDYTAEEEAQVRKEHAWAHEGEEFDEYVD